MTVLLLATLLWHGLRRLPPPPECITFEDGHWSISELGRAGMRLGHGTIFTGWWVRLCLYDERGRLVVLVARDQLEATAWRRLQATLRNPSL